MNCGVIYSDLMNSQASFIFAIFISHYGNILEKSKSNIEFFFDDWKLGNKNTLSQHKTFKITTVIYLIHQDLGWNDIFWSPFHLCLPQSRAVPHFLWFSLELEDVLYVSLEKTDALGWSAWSTLNTQQHQLSLLLSELNLFPVSAPWKRSAHGR